MRKEGLLDLPVAKPRPFPSPDSSDAGIVCFRVRIHRGHKLLVMDAFDTACQTLTHRVFIDKNDFVSASWEDTEKKWKWRAAMLDSLLGFWGWSSRKPAADQLSMAAVSAFFRSGADGAPPVDRVLRHQRQIASDRLHRKHRKVLDRIDAIMSHVRPLPKDFEAWLDAVPLSGERCLVYQYTGKARQPAYCSHCGSHVEVEGLRDRKPCVCPACHTAATAMAKGRMPNIPFINRVYAHVLQRYDADTLILRSFEVFRKFIPGSTLKTAVETTWRETVRQLVSKQPDGKALAFETFQMGQYKNNDRNPYSWIPYKDQAYHPASLYDRRLNEELRGTWAQYSAIDLLAKHSSKLFYPDVYLRRWFRMPSLELIVKGGLYRLALDLVSDMRYTPDFDRALLMRYSRALRTTDGGLDDLKVLKKLEEIGVTANAEHVRRWCALSHPGMPEERTLSVLLRYAPLNRICDYLEANRSRTKTTLRDLWSMQAFLGADMENKRTLFPKNLTEAHQTVTARYNLVKDERTSVCIKAYAEELRKKYSFHAFGMYIVVPGHPSDLINEGSTLCHCVRSYIDRVAKRETAILFIRREGETATPFFTMEVCDGRVIQVHGKKNSAPDKAVARFVRAFCERFGIRNTQNAA